MHQRARHCVCALLPLLALHVGLGQPNRITYNNQRLYLSGANVAWVHFANDIGPGTTQFATFSDILLQMHDAGGNAARWWLHTNGTTTPEFNASNVVVGPGTGSIADMRRVLDLAWEREIGLNLCLWSFDMLRLSNSPTVRTRNRLLLTDTNYTRTYINNSLVPMVDSLKGHPAIIAWEIFNEPEGMSNEFGWSDIEHVPMSAIQRFINMCAGAIHRTDTTANVTSGAWSFKTMTDVTSDAATAPRTALDATQQRETALLLKAKYKSSLTPEEILSHLDRISELQNFNYYADSRLIAAGGDPQGTLDFYSVHYYTGIDPGNPAGISPFHHPWSYWSVSKPIIVAEFAVQNTIGVPKQALYETLYHTGYAGALAWSWTDINLSTHADMLASMRFMWDNHRADVDVLGIGGYWPNVTITSPRNDTTFIDTVAIPVTAVASDSDGTVLSVKFFASDTILIGERTSPPYSITWTNVRRGIYTLTAIATDNQGHERTSNRVRITVGSPTTKRIEAESARRYGPGITLQRDASASGNAFLDIATNDATTTITWNVLNTAPAGTYEIGFGYRLFYASPKSQYINVNGVRAATVEFTASLTTTWYEKTMHVNLIQGLNTIQMQMFWGWMHLDYLSVPLSVEPVAPSIPHSVVLEQNYPNPFNTSTRIPYQLVESGLVTLKVFDLLGREVTTLVDETQNASSYTATLDAVDFASGVYFYRLSVWTSAGRVSGGTASKKMILVK